MITKKMAIQTLVVLIIAALLLFMAANTTVFEDGSYRVGPLTGCIPLQPCDDFTNAFRTARESGQNIPGAISTGIANVLYQAAGMDVNSPLHTMGDTFIRIGEILDIGTARYYSGGGAAGVAWEWGGIEYKGNPGLFICGGHYDPATGQFGDWWARLLPHLVTDC